MTSKRYHRVRGQQSIEPDRVMQIQQALIHEHYLNGEPTGKWDSTTVAAMQKYQSDQGWQTKLMPDSRALKKLGLGPDYSNALNAKDSSLSAPPPAGAIPAPQDSGFAAASGVNQ
ncbi:MAG: peptidoglycan-binding domain-containing protein [Terracidiphilus sp.]